MVLSELIKRTTESTAGKAAVVAVTVLAVAGVSFRILTSAECGSNNNGYGKQVSPQEMISGAQKSLDQLRANTTLPPSVKAAEIKHLEGEIAQAQGKSSTAPPGPPPQSAPPP